MQPKDIVTLAIAAYGAGLSTYNLFQALQRDRKRLKVAMSTGMYVYGGELGPPMVTVEVVNVGHRPVTVGAPTLRLGNGRKLALIGADGFDQFPKQLADGESGLVRLRYSHVAGALASAGYSRETRIRPICSDSTGKTFVGRAWTVDVRKWLEM